MREITSHDRTRTHHRLPAYGDAPRDEPPPKPPIVACHDWSTADLIELLPGAMHRRIERGKLATWCRYRSANCEVRPWRQLHPQADSAAKSRLLSASISLAVNPAINSGVGGKATE
jgi:hypothetical protein